MTEGQFPTAPGAVPGPVPGDRGPESVTEELRAAVRRLDGLQGRPVGEHVAHFDALHAALQDALASIDGV